MSISGHFHAKSGRKIHYSSYFVCLQLRVIYKTWISISSILITYEQTFNNSSQLAGKLPQTHPLFNWPTDFGCFSGTPVAGSPWSPRRRWFHGRGYPMYWGCRWLYIATNGLTIAPRWSSCLSVLSLLLQLVAMGVEMQSNMNLYEQIFMDLNNIIQEVLPNSSSNTNRVE